MKGLRIIFVLFPILCLLVFVPAVRAQGILDTKHNLSPTGKGTVKANTQTDTLGVANTEVCVYCHTPHGADADVAAPLWNRAQTTGGGSFKMYTSPTLDATTGTAPTGTSLACLSCHDGTVAFDALRNLPGPGGFNATPATDGTRTPWTFVGATADKKMPAGITNLSSDLRDDHPISMDYSLAASPSATSGDGSKGFRKATTDAGGKKCVGNPAPANCNADGALPLSSAAIGGSPDFVQCTSCHDPHRSNPNTFLRKSNDASALCLTCHIKDG